MSEPKKDDASGIWNTAVKVLTGVLTSGIIMISLGGLAMRDQLNRVEIVLDIGIKQINESITRIEKDSSKASALAAQNAQDIAEIKNTRFDTDDAKLVNARLHSIEQRVTILENKGRR